MPSSSKLFQPIKLGPIELKHRIVMAPLTRHRATAEHVPGPLAVEYYSQRASMPGTLLITEATTIAARAGGFANMPGIWSDEQIAGWKKITDAVHARGSYMALQMWAIGRVGEPEQLIKEGLTDAYVSASPIGIKLRDYAIPRELSIAEIQEFVKLYGIAAKDAIEKAGFDLVEIHSANSYLLEQFIHDSSNHRNDAYGGSIANRSRFSLEVIDAVVKAVGAERTAIRFSPWNTISEMGASDPIAQYSYLINALQRDHSSLAYIHIVEPRLVNSEKGHGDNDFQVPLGSSINFIRDIWKGPIISAGGYTPQGAMSVADKTGDLVAFGRSFLANPDLPYRIQAGLPLTKGDRSTYYLFGDFSPRGYTDYPFATGSQKLQSDCRA